MTRRIFILDDLRSISMAVEAAGFERQATDFFTLVRPFRHDGLEIVADFHDAEETIRENPRFDVWILDNDLAPGLEGFTFLRDMIDNVPFLVPEVVLSCSANPIRRAKIVSYHSDWLRSRQ